MAANQPKPRTWTIDGNPFLVDDEATLNQALGDVAVILTRIGGAVVIAADREQVADDYWQTKGFVFRWTSFAPAKRIEPESVDDDA